MNLENISAGLRIPNYKKLCMLLGEHVEAGNSKLAQIRKWEQYFAFQRDKNAYIITEIYAVPKAVDDQRMKYAQNLIPVLLKYLAVFGTSELTFERWFVVLGMVSEGLYDEKKHEEVCFLMGLKSSAIQKLLVMTNKLCRTSLMNVLRRLEKEAVITTSENEYIVTGNTRRLATVDERKQIKACKTQAMQMVDAGEMFSVHINPNRRKRFYETLHELYQEQYGWDRTYTLLQVTPLNTDEILKYSDMDVQPMLETLSNDLKNAITSQLRSECDKADKQHLQEWANDAVTNSFKLDRLTAESLIHILWNEI